MNNNSLESTGADGSETHSLLMGYILWLFGFLGAHRFYYGRPVSGVIYFCTFGLLFIGWFIDLFLMPRLDNTANLRFKAGPLSYNVSWVLLTFFGVLGLHRFYMGKWLSGFLYLITLGLFGFGILYDFLNLNTQIELENLRRR